jgi:hypothetical protein
MRKRLLIGHGSPEQWRSVGFAPSQAHDQIILVIAFRDNFLFLNYPSRL